MTTFEIGNIVFPLISGEFISGGSIKVGRFLGTGFFINSNGLFITCKHVIEALEKNQKIFMGQLNGPSAGDYLGINNICVHPRYDLAWGQVVTKKKTQFLTPYQGPYALGLDVGAFGFTDAGKQGGILSIDPRYLRGHLSRSAEEPYDFPTRKLCEVSFSVPSGFSGTALLTENYELLGMLYGNTESKIQAYSISEVTDDQTTFQEKAYRIIEFGLAHSVFDLIEIFNEERIIAFV